MNEQPTTIVGITVPSSDPAFLAWVAVHITIALGCVVAGLIAMLREKRRGGHSTSGTVYYWCLAMVCVSATVLAIMRWEHSWHLFVIGVFAFASATWGRMALRRRWRGWVRQHIVGMGASYILLLTAFYVDNGPNLPLWKELPPIAFWVLPAAVGVPIMLRALMRYPLVRSSPGTVEGKN